MKTYYNDTDKGRDRGFAREKSFGRDRGGFSKGGRRSDKPEMFDAVCDNCGDNCRVPFQPTSGKPIYCSDCFEQVSNDSGRGNDRGRDRDRSRGRDNEMYSAICDDCGRDCEVPFRPSGDKPIYCSRCFEKRGNTHESNFRDENPHYRSLNEVKGSKSDSTVTLEMFNALSSKVDKILEIVENKKVVRVKRAPKKTVVISDELQPVETQKEEETVIE